MAASAPPDNGLAKVPVPVEVLRSSLEEADAPVVPGSFVREWRDEVQASSVSGSPAGSPSAATAAAPLTAKLMPAPNSAVGGTGDDLEEGSRVEALYEGFWYVGRVVSRQAVEAGRTRWGVQCDCDAPGLIKYTTTIRTASEQRPLEAAAAPSGSAAGIGCAPGGSSPSQAAQLEKSFGAHDLRTQDGDGEPTHEVYTRVLQQRIAALNADTERRRQSVDSPTSAGSVAPHARVDLLKLTTERRVCRPRDLGPGASVLTPDQRSPVAGAGMLPPDQQSPVAGDTHGFLPPTTYETKLASQAAASAEPARPDPLPLAGGKQELVIPTTCAAFPGGGGTAGTQRNSAPSNYDSQEAVPPQAPFHKEASVPPTDIVGGLAPPRSGIERLFPGGTQDFFQLQSAQDGSIAAAKAARAACDAVSEATAAGFKDAGRASPRADRTEDDLPSATREMKQVLQVTPQPLASHAAAEPDPLLPPRSGVNRLFAAGGTQDFLPPKTRDANFLPSTAKHALEPVPEASLPAELGELPATDIGGLPPPGIGLQALFPGGSPDSQQASAQGCSQEFQQASVQGTTANGQEGNLLVPKTGINRLFGRGGTQDFLPPPRSTASGAAAPAQVEPHFPGGGAQAADPPQYPGGLLIPKTGVNRLFDPGGTQDFLLPTGGGFPGGFPGGCPANADSGFPLDSAVAADDPLAATSDISPAAARATFTSDMGQGGFDSSSCRGHEPGSSSRLGQDSNRAASSGLVIGSAGATCGDSPVPSTEVPITRECMRGTQSKVQLESFPGGEAPLAPQLELEEKQLRSVSATADVASSSDMLANTAAVHRSGIGSMQQQLQQVGGTRPVESFPSVAAPPAPVQPAPVQLEQSQQLRPVSTTDMLADTAKMRRDAAAKRQQFLESEQRDQDMIYMQLSQQSLRGEDLLADTAAVRRPLRSMQQPRDDAVDDMLANTAAVKRPDTAAMQLQVQQAEVASSSDMLADTAAVRRSGMTSNQQLQQAEMPSSRDMLANTAAVRRPDAMALQTLPQAESATPFSTSPGDRAWELPTGVLQPIQRLPSGALQPIAPPQEVLPTGVLHPTAASSQQAPPVPPPPLRQPLGTAPQPSSQHELPQALGTASVKQQLVDQLVALGFSAKQAAEASRRTSSVEAGVEWILQHGLD